MAVNDAQIQLLQYVAADCHLQRQLLNKRLETYADLMGNHRFGGSGHAIYEALVMAHHAVSLAGYLADQLVKEHRRADVAPKD